MRIYGGHDYYDCVLGYGADPSVVLVRKNEKLPPQEVPIPQPLRLHLHNAPQSSYLDSITRLRHIIVVFCSKIYYGAEIEGQYFWSADKLHAWVAEHRGFSVSVSGPWRGGTWRTEKHPYTLEEYFAVSEASDDLREYLITNRYAIILKLETLGYGEPEVFMNPHSLKRLDFAKALDPYTAYQELSMWVGGVLAGESPKIVKIVSDRVLLEGHGFDNVFSFRGPRIK